MVYYGIYLPFSYPSVKNQGRTTSPHSKVHYRRCPVPVSCVGLAVLIALVGVAVYLLPLPFVNDWHRMCWNGIPWPWDRGQSDTCTAAGIYLLHLVTVSVQFVSM